MIINLSDTQKKLLITLKSKVGGKDLDVFDAALRGDVEIKAIDRLCGLINEEFMMEGIDENFEPNQYGIELEGLLDAINKPRLVK